MGFHFPIYNKLRYDGQICILHEKLQYKGIECFYHHCTQCKDLWANGIAETSLHDIFMTALSLNIHPPYLLSYIFYSINFSLHILSATINLFISYLIIGFAGYVSGVCSWFTYVFGIIRLLSNKLLVGRIIIFQI